MRRGAFAALAAVVLGVLVPAGAEEQPEFPAIELLPPCPVGPDVSTRRPSGPPTPDSPMCRAQPTLVTQGPPGRAPAAEPDDEGHVPPPSPGYHHLGAQTFVVQVQGAMASMTVRNPGARVGTFDFFAARILAKRNVSGAVRWVEVGWSENGWLNDDRRRIYTFDTTHGVWEFYGQYGLADGQTVTVALEPTSCVATCTWTAFLWWSNQWNALHAVEVPFDSLVAMEQYGEVYTVDGVHYALPRVDFTGVQVRYAGLWVNWSDPPVASSWSGNVSPYCATAVVPYTTWNVRSCP